MTRWLIWFWIGLALCGCHVAGRAAAPTSNTDCPAPDPCDDAGSDSQMIPAYGPVPTVRLAEKHPLWPGCPASLQVMARLHPIAFHAVRPDETPDSDTDPSDWFCDPPEAPLLRAGPLRPARDVAAR
jgi:hypothetical protein